jgi:glucosyl-3-phosphoglycerate synthase
MIDDSTALGPSPGEKAATTRSPATTQPSRYVSVVIPALNEAARIASVVRHALADPATAEVLVIDDSSIDETASLAAEAGARVVRSSLLGKGASMKDGAALAQYDVIVYLDGDLAGLRPGLVSDLARPIASDHADFVKARFGRAGGRVTELTAKPMLRVFFPEIAHFAQPLGGLIAAKRTLLRSLAFEDGYGVDIGLLIDAQLVGARLAEVDIGSIENDSQPLLDLTLMAAEVARVIFGRAKHAGRLHVDQVAAMYEGQRQAAGSIDYMLTRRRGRSHVLLLDMDGTITPDRYVQSLAIATGRQEALAELLDSPTDDAATRSHAIANLFRFVHRSQFEQVARAMPLRPGMVEFVREMRRSGFMVGIVSDSWFIAADILRRRIFADFAVAHLLQFDNDTFSGRVQLNPAFTAVVDDGSGIPSKHHVVERFRDDPVPPRVTDVWAVGDNVNDTAMLRCADRAFVIEPKRATLVAETGATLITSFDDIVALLDVMPSARGVGMP